MNEALVLLLFVMLVFLFTPFKYGRVKVGNETFTAAIADNPLSRFQGLILKPYKPMLFVFEHSGNVCFWSPLVFYPLYLHFYDESGRLVKVTALPSNSFSQQCGVAKYVLELNHVKQQPLVGFEELGTIPAFLIPLVD